MREGGGLEEVYVGSYGEGEGRRGEEFGEGKAGG